MKVWPWQLAEYLTQGEFTWQRCVKTWGFEFYWSRPLTDEQIARAVWGWRLWQHKTRGRRFKVPTRQWGEFPKEHMGKAAPEVIAAKKARRQAYFAARAILIAKWDAAREEKLKRRAERKAKRQAG
jgi:hypothetical protein